jgi:hypothetical protein
MGNTGLFEKFLEEGLARNPTSYKLNFRRGQIAFKEKEYHTAFEYGMKSLRLTDEEFAQLDSLRLIYWSAKELDNRETQKRALVDLLKLRPGDPLWTKEFKELLK